MSMAALSTPAAALTFSEAVMICAKNPGYSPGVRDRSGGHTMLIKQSDGTTSVVDCPARGPCVVMAKTDPKGGKATPGSVSNVLGAPSSGTKGGGKPGAMSPGGKVTTVLPSAASPKEPKPHDSQDHPSQHGGARGK